MKFMNRWDIDEAVDLHRKHPVLSKATTLLRDLRDLVDNNSDGWAYWTAPVRAAKKLMDLIDDANPRRDRPTAVTEADLKKAIVPIKSFYTRHRDQLKDGTLTFPVFGEEKVTT